MLKKRSKLLIVGVILLSIILFYFLTPLSMLEVLEIKNNRTILIIPFNTNDQFTIRIIHSCAKTPYLVTYGINSENEIIILEAKFQSTGGGFPEDTKGFVSGRKYFKVNYKNKIINSFLMRVSALSEDTLIIKDREMPLYKVVKEGDLIKFKVSKHPRIFSIKNVANY